jgi:Zinc carboxypeptidase
MCWMISRERVVVAALALGAGWLASSGRALNARVQVDAIAALRTVPERTDYRETSRYADVMDFLRTVDAASTAIHLTTFGTTVEKRELPLAVAGAAAATPGAVRATGKLRVYIQANIHGGEVEGKESAQALLRTLAGGGHAGWLEHMTLLVAPIYNADGNERVALDNRGPQHGPLGGQGQRANAQGLDLNRDHIKLDSPEARAVVRLMNEYDPHVSIDLHTTNGSHHAYLLTYAPPLHPATDPLIVRLLRLEWLPRVTATIRAKHGWDAYYYGNLQGTSRVPGAPDERSWRTFDHRPRFNNNYVGLRNRFAVLSEAYAYASFRDRILATDRFLEENLNYIQANAASIRRITDEADRRPLIGASLPLRAEPERAPDTVEILLGDVASEKHPVDGHVMHLRTESKIPERMAEYGSFRGTELERVPAAYFVPAGLTAAIDRLRAHGIALEPLKASAPIDAETFHVHSSDTAAKPFQNHHERTLTGAWTPSRRTLPPGTLRVDMSQPLARLAFYLLEPRSDDGLVNWNVMDEELRGAKEYPVVRTRN